MQPAFGTSYSGNPVGPAKISLAGAMDVADHQIIGAPLYLTAKEGTNITMEALNGGQIVMHSPIKMAGPIIPRNVEYATKGDSSSGGEVAMVQVVGTVKVQNLQFDLVESESMRTAGSAQPGMLCTYATVRARAPDPLAALGLRLHRLTQSCVLCADGAAWMGEADARRATHVPGGPDAAAGLDAVPELPPLHLYGEWLEADHEHRLMYGVKIKNALSESH